MYSLTVLLLACVGSALITAVICGIAARTWVDAVRDGERRQYEESLRHLREEYSRDLHDLQSSLTTEVEALRDRARHPLRTLVDSLFT